MNDAAGGEDSSHLENRGGTTSVGVGGDCDGGVGRTTQVVQMKNVPSAAVHGRRRVQSSSRRCTPVAVDGEGYRYCPPGQQPQARRYREKIHEEESCEETTMKVRPVVPQVLVPS